MIRFVMSAMLVCAVSPAIALSCLRPDAVDLLNMAAASEDAFYVVRGRVTLQEPARQARPGSKRAALTRAHVVGEALSDTGFRAPFDREITLAATCLGHWCGKAADHETSFLAIRLLDGGALQLGAGPCGGDIVPWDQDGEDRLLSCHLGGPCVRAKRP